MPDTYKIAELESLVGRLQAFYKSTPHTYVDELGYCVFCNCGISGALEGEDELTNHRSDCLIREVLSRDE